MEVKGETRDNEVLVIKVKVDVHKIEVEKDENHNHRSRCKPAATCIVSQEGAAGDIFMINGPGRSPIAVSDIADARQPLHLPGISTEAEVVLWRKHLRQSRKTEVIGTKAKPHRWLSTPKKVDVGSIAAEMCRIDVARLMSTSRKVFKLLATRRVAKLSVMVSVSDEVLLQVLGMCADADWRRLSGRCVSRSCVQHHEETSLDYLPSILFLGTATIDCSG